MPGGARSTDRGTPEYFSAALTIKPLTLDAWEDFVQLFEQHGVQNGCWCMYWHGKRADCYKNYGEGNKQAFKRIVEAGKIPGFLAYAQNRPVGWCSIAPREDFSVLERSPTLKRVDSEPVWSIVCFFVSKEYRHQGMTERLIIEAIEYARVHGGKIIEAYPLRSEAYQQQPYERFMGDRLSFERAGFEVVAGESNRRPVMRFYLEKQGATVRSTREE